MNRKTPIVNSSGTKRTLRLGFVPLADCAPLAIAHELGLFRKYGLDVALNRELGWATIRDKIIHGELDAAHALAAMPVAATLGLGSIPCDCVTALVLNLNGNAITLSNDLWKRGVRDGAALREEVIRMRRQKVFTFGAVSPFSSHHYLLRNWLMSAGIQPGRDVRIVVVPPPQMVANLKAGHLDGFCVGEPWNSVAVQERIGWCVATSAELQPLHPEKVLMVRNEFAEKRPEEHLALVAALLDACEYCDVPENRKEVVAILSRPEYVNASIEALQPGFEGRFDFGHDVVRMVKDFCVFHQQDANEPTSAKAAWIFQLIRSAELGKETPSLNFALGRQIFRSDLFEKAVRFRRSLNPIHENETKSETKILCV